MNTTTYATEEKAFSGAAVSWREQIDGELADYEAMATQCNGWSVRVDQAIRLYGVVHAPGVRGQITRFLVWFMTGYKA